jgi:hypothetical protein
MVTKVQNGFFDLLSTQIFYSARVQDARQIIKHFRTREGPVSFIIKNADDNLVVQ